MLLKLKRFWVSFSSEFGLSGICFLSINFRPGRDFINGRGLLIQGGDYIYIYIYIYSLSLYIYIYIYIPTGPDPLREHAVARERRLGELPGARLRGPLTFKTYGQMFHFNKYKSRVFVPIKLMNLNQYIYIHIMYRERERERERWLYERHDLLNTDRATEIRPARRRRSLARPST